MNITKIDWCGYRSKARVDALLSGVSSLFSPDDDFRAVASGRGWNGYETSIDLTIRGKRIGLMATGGDNQKGWSQVNLTGEAMDHIRNVPANLSGVVSEARGQYKRVDIALTTVDGSVSAKTVTDAYWSGGFTVGKVAPSIKTILPGDPTEGTTVYIGKRTQPCFCRSYDKGYEMLQKWNNALPEGSAPYTPDDFTIDGRRLSDIFRIELELKLEPSLFPEDVLERSDSYFAGAYPYLGRLVDSQPETFRLTPQRVAQLNLNQALGHIKKQWGNTLFTALAVNGGDYMAVWQKIVGKEHSKSLIEAGVMFADIS